MIGYPANLVSALLLEMERMERARQLLVEIWLDLGPYTDKLPLDLRMKLNEFMELDDSE